MKQQIFKKRSASAPLKTVPAKGTEDYELMLDGYKRRFGKQGEQLADLRARISEMADEVDEATEAFRIEQEAKVKTAERRAQGLSEDASEAISELQAEVARLRAERDGLTESHLGELEEIRGRYESDIADLRSLLDEGDTASLDLMTEYQKKVSEVGHLEGRVKRISAQLEAAKSEGKSVRVLRQSPVKPESIDFDYAYTEDRLLRRVVMKAQGYDDVAVDIIRGPDRRFTKLEVTRVNQ